jgi:large subunit ribosomal protein L10Ae
MTDSISVPSTAGKFPTPVSHAEDLSNKLTEVRSTIKFQLKKVLCLGVAVGHIQMTEDQVLGNVMLCKSAFYVLPFSIPPD